MKDFGPDPAFKPISPNPFIVGNPVRDPSMFFGRLAEFELVRKRFDNQTRGGLIVFCGERRSGKTSILFQILEGRLGPSFLPVLIDMQSMAIENEADFFGRIADEIRLALGTELAPLDPSAASTASGVFRKFIEQVLLRHPEKKPILLFDEYELFENKIEAGTLSEDTLNTLTSLMERYPVFLIFTGSQHLEDRRQPYWKILPKSIYRNISFLQPQDAVGLITKPIEGRVVYASGVVEKLLRLTAGQPFYTQAICQSLIDLLNEKRTRHATDPLLAEVVDAIVDNPFPQMIFLWDGLSADEKIVLALLAEVLPDETSAADATQVTERVRRGKYPLAISEQTIASVLEGLFQKELLGKDANLPPRYDFRMDLWRRWVRRMHSVWQVVREHVPEDQAGRGAKPASGGRLRIALYVAAAAVLAMSGLVIAFRSSFHPFRGETGASRPAGSYGVVQIDAEPSDAAIEFDGKPAGYRSITREIPAGRSPLFRVKAPGFVDTTFTFEVAVGETIAARLRLRALHGGVQVTTDPPGADVWVDDQPRGRSPVVVSDLDVPDPHRIEARMADRQTISQDFRVEADTTRALHVSLVSSKGTLTVHTEPAGAAIQIDEAPRGTSPFSRADLAYGPHRVRANLAGRVPAETSVVIGDAPAVINWKLKEPPPGLLILKGDRPAQLLVDGISVGVNVQNSGPRNVRPGPHEIQVIFVSGEVVQDTLVVSSREKVVYDYSARAVVLRERQEAAPK